MKSLLCLPVPLIVFVLYLLSFRFIIILFIVPIICTLLIFVLKPKRINPIK